MIRQLAPYILFALLLVALVPRASNAFVFGGDFGSPEEREAIEAAERAFDFREFDLALELTGEALRDFPDSMEALRLLGLIASHRGELSRVLRRFDPENFPTEDRWRAHYLRGWVTILTGDPRLAIRELELAKAQLGQPTPYELERALLVARRMVPGQDPRQLAAHYDDFLQRWSHIPLTYVSVLNYFNFNDPGRKARRRLIQEALSREEVNPAVYGYAARLEERDFWFDPAKGLEWVEKGLESHPESTELALRRIMYMRQLGMANEALEYCRQWREKAPNHGDFRIDEIDLLADMVRWEEAIEAALLLPEMQHQEQYTENHAIRLARLYHYNNEPQMAIEVLNDFLEESRSPRHRNEAATFLTRLQTRSPEDRVNILPNIGYLTQRGNYCGPATISMVLRYWNKDLSQDNIAERVYTGIAGTPPQVIRNYARTIGFQSVEFAGTKEKWKRLIDAGFPILWLQFMREGGHYRVVTGYDDIHNAWVVHDPNNFRREFIGYDEVDDLWILPNVVRSIVLFPPEEADNPALAGLYPTPMMHLTNGVLYIATGSNLFVGLFPAVLINILAATLIALLIAWQLRRITFPSNSIRYTWVLGFILAIIIPGNLLVGLFRLNNVVSLLLGFHLALLTLVPLLLFTSIGLRLIKDYLHRRESLGIALICIMVWLSLSFIDRSPWEWVVPIGLFVVGMPIIMAPRIWLRQAEKLSYSGDTPGALIKSARLGLRGNRYYSALCVELECLLTVGRIPEFLDRAETLRDANVDDAIAHEMFGLCVLLGEVLLPGTETRRHDLSDKITQWIDTRPPRRLSSLPALHGKKPVTQLTRLAEGLLLYVENLDAESARESADKWPAERVDSLLRELGSMSSRRLPGLSRSRSLRGRPILDTILLLALIGATRSAQSEAEHDRLDALWTMWSSRYALMIELLGHLDPPTPTRPLGVPETEVAPIP
ncbi:MAG: C39 family peptidase [Candidatus Sumerlaeia bacterium]|nr:C39 family peptidase [Candidatus Sumerlaeia bacterium]